MDNHTKALNSQTIRAQIWGAVMDYREEYLSFSELFMFLQTFDREISVDDTIAFLGRSYRGE